LPGVWQGSEHLLSPAEQSLAKQAVLSGQDIHAAGMQGDLNLLSVRLKSGGQARVSEGVGGAMRVAGGAVAVI
jgi:hypothetical protein